MTLEQHRFELHGSTCMWIFFPQLILQYSMVGSWLNSPMQNLQIKMVNCGTWESVNFDICHGSWNQFPMDTKGWLQVPEVTEVHYSRTVLFHLTYLRIFHVWVINPLEGDLNLWGHETTLILSWELCTSWVIFWIPSWTYTSHHWASPLPTNTFKAHV